MAIVALARATTAAVQASVQPGADSSPASTSDADGVGVLLYHFMIGRPADEAPAGGPLPRSGAQSAPADEIPARDVAPPTGPGAARGMRDRSELEAFLDGLMAANLADRHVAGATVAVVKDGALFFAKGYGDADVEKRTPVDATRTLFRIGSVTKLFTWTAIMQLVEQGKVDLNADVNHYLDFKIPSTYPQAITLKHVMTHTTGFEEDVRDLFTTDPARIIPIERWLETHIPERVRPPGIYSSYSNYATALAGHVVERVSGMSWEDYIEQHILRPLGMTHTTVRQPLPDRFRRDMSQGYTFADGRFEPKPWEMLMGAAPAGAMSSSATDMAIFMLAHLGNGAFDGRRILRDETAVQMHARAFGHDPRLPGFALGFYEKSSHGLRIIGHGGNTQWFHTDMALIPSENVGVFVSYNTDGGHELSIGPFLDEFLDHYYPTSSPPALLGPEALAQAERVAGEYRFNRMSYTTFQRVAGLLGAIRIRSNGDGSLRMRDMRLLPVGPLLYRDELGRELIAFQRDRRGVAHAFLGGNPTAALERVPWYESARLHSAILGIAVVVFAGTLWAAIRRVLRRRFRAARPDDALRGRPLLVWLAAADLAFIGAFLIMGLGSPQDSAAATKYLEVTLALPVIGAGFAASAVAAAVLQWKRREGTFMARLRYDAAVLIGLLFIWSLNEWNLLGWRL